MKIYVTMKQLGKKKSVLTKKMIEISNDIYTLKELLKEIVTMNVTFYNEQKTEQVMVPFLTNEEILDRTEVGKVGFEIKYKDEFVSIEKTLLEVEQSFIDGLYSVFIEDQQVEDLNDELNLKEGDTLTFIKLTMLAGRMW